jgi:hypothetical protein
LFQNFNYSDKKNTLMRKMGLGKGWEKEEELKEVIRKKRVRE